MKNEGVELLDILSNIIQVLNYSQNVEQTSKDDLLVELTLKNNKCLEEILKILKENKQ